MKLKNKIPFLFSAQLFGTLCGGALGALKTGEVALMLLEKNKALAAADIISLPGPSHWETMASWKPAGAGAVFFGLSLGLGFGTLMGLWVKCASFTPGKTGKIAQWAPAFLAVWAIMKGDAVLAAMFVAMLCGIIALHSIRSQKRSLSRNVLLPLTCLALISVGIWPWATAGEGPFTRMRDKLFLGSSLGLGVNSFYYRWTLYPAEVLKPLAYKTQPVVSVEPGLPAEFTADFCEAIDKFNGICLPDKAAGADLSVAVSENGVREIRAGDVSVPWPSDLKKQQEAWEELSTKAYRFKATKSATAWALIGGMFLSEWPMSLRYASILAGGCPLALIATLAGIVMWLGGKSGPWKTAMALGFSVLIAVGLGFSGWSNKGRSEVLDTFNRSPIPSIEEVRNIFENGDNVVRFYTTREMRRYGARAIPLLTRALADPDINIRYAACESLGEIDSSRSKMALKKVLEGNSDWYVKDRAYFALRRLGWRPN